VSFARREYLVKFFEMEQVLKEQVASPRDEISIYEVPLKEINADSADSEATRA
jgi:hypothetical protein